MQFIMVELWQNQVNFYRINFKMVNCGKKHRTFRLSNQEMICDRAIKKRMICDSAIKKRNIIFFLFGKLWKKTSNF